MGTRSITNVYEMDELGKDSLVCTFYRQYDGYPTGHGDDLASWLKGKRLVNGIRSDFRDGIDHNRAGQMAIELMHDLKSETSIEIIPTGSTGHWEEYIYEIRFSSEFEISVTDVNNGKTYKELASEFSGEKAEEMIHETED